MSPMKKTLYRTAGKLLLAVFLITVFTMWTYHGTTKNDLVWDTVNYLVYHVWWISNLSVDNIIWMFLSFEVSNWHPLTWLSHMLDCELFGLDAGWHHLSSVLLHAVAAVLAFLALRSLGIDGWPSLVVAALFAVHPLRVESVAWASEAMEPAIASWAAVVAGIDLCPCVCVCPATPIASHPHRRCL